jgi:superfamily II DNA or RNA helicase
MSEGLAALHLDIEYRTGENDLVSDFYEPCLSAARWYDRAVGYFRSSIFIVIGESLIDFARRGGRLRLVCSPELTEEDYTALSTGYKNRETIVGEALSNEIDSLLRNVDTREQTIALATMVSVGAMDIRIALRPAHLGLFHEKLGIFTDDYGNAVSFKGSSNETWNAWHDFGNHESFEVFRSWIGTTEAQRIDRHKSYFERLWVGDVKNVDTTPFPKVAFERLRKEARPSLEDIVLKRQVERKGRQLFQHQNLAIENWKAQNKRGILQHATGSGKTITALAAMREHLGNDGCVIVLVPSVLLLTQWVKEIEAEIDEVTILTAGGGNNLWKKLGRLESFSSSYSGLGRRVIVATLQTARKVDFRNRLYVGDHLMLVCDEVHRAGSSDHARVLDIDSGPRLGLSATPIRYGDPEGTARIMAYFNGVIPPPFTLEDAIKAGRLVPYEYHPYTVSLTEEENKRWEELTKIIRREYALLHRRQGRPIETSERLKTLLIKRARIAKKAAAKVDLAEEILKHEYTEGEHWLVYCEDTEQLESIRARLTSLGLPVNEYHTGMQGAPEETLRWFDNFGGVLISIRCLDEGVDIPQTSHALILASSQNPREFIQRRGRVLRVAPDKPEKRVAIIYDAIIVPTHVEDEVNQISITKSEIARALEFAKGAINRAAGAELMELAIHIGIDIKELEDVGVEDEEVNDNE